MAKYLAGVDEVGRGPLAGPVVTAAVMLNKPIAGIKDSKRLTAPKREQLADKIKEEALCFSYGRAEVGEINCLNIHHATLLAMKRAIEALPIQPDEVLVDGLYLPDVSMPCRAIVQGDKLIAEISAASILAKVQRDCEMVELDVIYPGYGFSQHKGYCTVSHRSALNQLGPCPIHRCNYGPVTAATEKLLDSATVE